MNGFHLVHWSRTQATVSTSSCEAELIAMYVGYCEGSLIRSILADMHDDRCLCLWSDSAPSIRVTAMRGLGRGLKHLDCKYLVLQEARRRGDIQVQYVKTECNMADLFTKTITGRTFTALRERIGLRVPVEHSIGEPYPYVIAMIAETGGSAAQVCTLEDQQCEQGVQWWPTSQQLYNTAVGLLAIIGLHRVTMQVCAAARCLCRGCSRRHAVRDVAVQSPCTYTEVREGVLHPRFQVLPGRDQGAFVD